MEMREPAQMSLLTIAVATIGCNSRIGVMHSQRKIVIMLSVARYKRTAHRPCFNCLNTEWRVELNRGYF